MSKYHGDFNTLKSNIEDYGLKGEWSDANNMQKFTTSDGAILLWYKTTKTLQCQGKEGRSKSKILEFIQQLNETTQSVVTLPVTKNSSSNPTLFIVYGHDIVSREQLEFILTKIGVEHSILSKLSGNGLTLIEALEKHVGQKGTASAGIVLLTPDDMGYAKKDGADTVKNRARQNVILEMGMLMSKLGRSNTIILIKGDIERPSDTDGIIYHPYQNHVKEIAQKLTERLTDLGFTIDPQKILEAIR